MWAPSITKTAAAIGISRTVVDQYLAEGCPGKTEKGYDLEAIRAWRCANKLAPRSTGKRVRENGGGGDEDEMSDVARYNRHRADLEATKSAAQAFELEVTRGMFLPIAEVKERDLARISIIKRGLVALEKALPDKLVGLGQREMAVIIRAATRSLLERFSEM